MKKTLIPFRLPVILLSAVSLTLLSACSGQVSEAPAEETSPAGETDQEETDQDEIEIVCWGDSMTSGVGAPRECSYPAWLERKTGFKTYNFGVGGATSEEIAIMQGGITPEDDLSNYDLDEEVMKLGQEHPGDILILEIGSNGGWNDDYDLLIEQYRAMIDHSGCTRYIIIGDTDDPLESVDDAVVEAAEELAENEEYMGDAETTWETALRKEFGAHFINMRLFLIREGLETAYLTPTEEDEEDAENGIISVQLRSDWTHLNIAGYYAKAVCVYKKGVELGYWG